MDTMQFNSAELPPCQIFDPQKDGTVYAKYRIPGMIVTANDTILVSWEMRKDIDTDTGDTQIAVLRSADGGKTFTAVLTIDDGKKSMTNPMMMVGKDGTIHFLYACNVGNGGVYYRYSTKKQDGTAWSEPVNIVEALKKETVGWSMCNPGPGHGICVQRGPYAGRLIVPIWCYTGAYKVYTLYSDDNGKNWNLGDRASENLDETSIAELSDGSVMLNSRQFGVCYAAGEEWKRAHHHPKDETEAYRHITISKTGISDWCKTYLETALPQPSLQGGMCTTVIKDQQGHEQYVLLFVNCKTKIGFKRLTVSCSLDDGKTWSRELVINEKAGGYADIAVDSHGKVYVLYEMLGPDYVWLKLVTFDIAELLKNDL